MTSLVGRTADTAFVLDGDRMHVAKIEPWDKFKFEIGDRVLNRDGGRAAGVAEVIDRFRAIEDTYYLVRLYGHAFLVLEDHIVRHVDG